ncbi:MAG: extracellular solute-binding protein [Clostridiales bacterium]|nr:extracellular solute-binding protein [Clostridiales bacterium]
MKLIAMLLAVLIFLSALSACGSEAEKSDTVTDAETTAATESETTSAEYTCALPEIDFENATFRILAAAEQWQNYYYIETETGEIIEDAVFKRNLDVEDKYGIDIEYRIFNGYSAGMDSVKKALTASVMSGGGDYDLLVGSSSYIGALVPEGLFSKLNRSDYIDLEAPWWFQGINNEIKVNNSLYIGAGAYGMLNYAWAVPIFFNKKTVEDYNLEDIYNTVDTGKWTYDRMCELCSKVTSDLDGDGKYTTADMVGMVSTYDYMSMLSSSMGCRFSRHESDGSVIIEPYSERIASVIEKLQRFSGSDLYLEVSTSEKESYQYQSMIETFAGGHALFLCHRLNHCEKEALRNMDGYGIIPPPKYDESQSDYITYIPAEVAGIPYVVTNDEMSQIILEALQYQTYKDVVPQYYDIALKNKYAQDPVAGRMLDIIFGNVICPFTYVYSKILGGEALLYIVESEDTASKYASSIDMVQTKLDKMLDKIKENDND